MKRWGIPRHSTGSCSNGSRLFRFSVLGSRFSGSRPSVPPRARQRGLRLHLSTHYSARSLLRTLQDYSLLTSLKPIPLHKNHHHHTDQYQAYPQDNQIGIAEGRHGQTNIHAKKAGNDGGQA